MNPVAEIIAEEIVDRGRKMRLELKQLNIPVDIVGRTEAEYLLRIASKVIKEIIELDYNIGCTAEEIKTEVSKIVC